MKKILNSALRLIKRIVYAVKVTFSVLLFRFIRKRVVFLLGTPSHINIGDLAIMKAEIDFIEGRFKKTSVIEVPQSFMENNSKYIYWLIRDSDLVVGIGGGNFGDMYLPEENCRRNYISNLPNNKIVLFPQTIHFTSTPSGESELDKSIEIYGNHNNLTIIAREDVSYDLIKRMFSKNKVILTPDIVLSLGVKLRKVQRSGALVCLRSDSESTLDEEDHEKLKGWMRSKFEDVKITDTLDSSKLFKFKPRMMVVKAKLKEFAGAEFILTDRLHGMVFAAITGTPCIALTNFNYKVKGTYNWISKLPYIHFCDDASRLDDIYKKIDLQKSYVYDPHMHEEYWRKIVSNCETQVKEAL